MQSEVELDESIVALQAYVPEDYSAVCFRCKLIATSPLRSFPSRLAAVPELYEDFVKMNPVPSLLGLLSHENAGMA